MTIFSRKKHLDVEKGSDCYQTNYGIVSDLEKEKTKEGHDNIEKLLMECKKDMFDFSEYFDSRPGKRHCFNTTKVGAKIQYSERKKRLDIPNKCLIYLTITIKLAILSRNCQKRLLKSAKLQQQKK